MREVEAVLWRRLWHVWRLRPARRADPVAAPSWSSRRHRVAPAARRTPRQDQCTVRDRRSRRVRRVRPQRSPL